ncbi:MAG: RING finger domain-containing protein [Promethearchaeota archaeon]
MPSCIICHMSINKTDKVYECPNKHPTHKTCLIEWLMHAKTCPLCQDPYSSDVIETLQLYLDAREKQKEEAYKEEELKETLIKMEKVAEKIVFLKQVEFIENLVENKEYEPALERLEAMDDLEKPLNYRSQYILFLRGKINYLRGRFDLAINLLFRLVKAKFDFPDAFLYLGKSYEQLGLSDKAKWAYERIK